VEVKYRIIADALARDIIVMPHAMYQRSGFHAFFFMEPLKEDELDTDFPRLHDVFEPCHGIGTTWQCRLLRCALWKARNQNSSDFLRSLSSNPTAFGLAFESVILDNMCQGLLEEQFELLESPQAHFSLPQTKLVNAESGFYLMLDGDLPELKNSTSYFITVDLKFPTIDAAPEEVILLQVAISKRQSVKPAGIRRVHDLVMGDSAGDGGRKWRFLFVVATPEYGRALAASTSSSTAVTIAKKDLDIDLAMGFLHVPLRASPVRLFFPVLREYLLLNVARRGTVS
jgi:hypothetical protein